MAVSPFGVERLGNRAQAVKYTAFDAVTLDGVTTSQATIILFEGRTYISLVEQSTGTLTATLTCDISNNYDVRRPALARWAPITDATIIAFLTSGKPAGAPLGPLSVQSGPLKAAAIRWTATRTAGSGTYSLDVEML